MAPGDNGTAPFVAGPWWALFVCAGGPISPRGLRSSSWLYDLVWDLWIIVCSLIIVYLPMPVGGWLLCIPQDPQCKCLQWQGMAAMAQLFWSSWIMWWVLVKRWRFWIIVIVCQRGGVEITIGATPCNDNTGPWLRLLQLLRMLSLAPPALTWPCGCWWGQRRRTGGVVDAAKRVADAALAELCPLVYMLAPRAVSIVWRWVSEQGQMLA